MSFVRDVFALLSVSAFVVVGLFWAGVFGGVL
jgi:hypothetical protein